MAKEKRNFFIDTNILVDYILLNDILKPEDRKSFPIYDTFEPSLKLINLLFENKNKIRWNTSFINLFEIPPVLMKRIVMDKMFLKGVSFDYFEKYYSKFLKEKDFQEEVEKIMEKYYSFLKKDGGLWYVNIFSIKREVNFKEMDKLRLKYRLSLGDSLIFFMAKLCKGYFVTRDGDFKQNNLPKDYKNDINIISPRQALQKAKKLLDSKK